LSNQPSIVGVWPSSATSVSSALTSRQAGLSIRAWLEEWMSVLGYLSDVSPPTISWNSTAP